MLVKIILDLKTLSHFADKFVAMLFSFSGCKPDLLGYNGVFW